MRCKRHLSDHSSSVGVCASCLRERLSALVAAQAQAQSQLNQHHTGVTAEDRRKQPQDPPPPLLFPRSVSPYVSRRKSDDTTASTWAYPSRFYSTPQVRPTSTAANLAVHKRNRKFSLLSNLFRSRSDKCDSHPRVAYRDSSEPEPSSSSSSSPSSWFFSTIFPSRRKKKSSAFCYADDSTANGRRACRTSNRGMSPARETESDDDCDRSPWGSGDSTEEWRRTPTAAVPAVRRTRTTAHVKNVSGLAFCLSPLVRASPNRHWNQKGGLQSELVYSGEVRNTTKPHLSTAASFCANRSRKLADFGRVNHNR